MNIDFSKYVVISKKLLNKPKSNYKHFSFIINKNETLSVGWNNSKKTHPKAFEYGYPWAYLHSEVSAIIKFPDKPSLFKHCSIINIRLSKFSSKLLLARPCKLCQKTLIELGFRSIFYSNEHGLFERLVF